MAYFNDLKYRACRPTEVTMKYRDVSSSMLAQVAYSTSEAMLAVRFNDGREYHFFNVPERVHAELLEAPSIGQYFNLRIRNSGYAFERVS